MSSEQLQDLIDELTGQLAALEREQRSIPAAIAEAVETFDRPEIMRLRERSGTIADELFDLRSEILQRTGEMLDAEDAEASAELEPITSEIDELRSQIDELQNQQRPLVGQARKLHGLLERNRERRKTLRREREALATSERQRLQTAAAAFVAPSVKALNVGNPMIVL